MAVQRFQVSTRRTGMLRIAKVEVYDSQADMLPAFNRAWAPHGLAEEANPDTICATCIPRTAWEDRDPRPYQARIMLHREALTGVIVAHEAAHAALHFYSIDSYRDNARASAHLDIRNELVPYMLGDIFSGIAQRLQLTDPLPIGYGQHYQEE